AAVSRQSRTGNHQRDRQSRAQPAVPGSVRPLRLRHAVGRARGSHGRRPHRRRAARPQPRQSLPSAVAAPAPRGAAGDSRAVLRDLSRSSPSNDGPRRRALALDRGGAENAEAPVSARLRRILRLSTFSLVTTLGFFVIAELVARLHYRPEAL